MDVVFNIVTELFLNYLIFLLHHFEKIKLNRDVRHQFQRFKLTFVHLNK